MRQRIRGYFASDTVNPPDTNILSFFKSLNVKSCKTIDSLAVFRLTSDIRVDSCADELGKPEGFTPMNENMYITVRHSFSMWLDIEFHQRRHYFLATLYITFLTKCTNYFGKKVTFTVTYASSKISN